MLLVIIIMIIMIIMIIIDIMIIDIIINLMDGVPEGCIVGKGAVLQKAFMSPLLP